MLRHSSLLWVFLSSTVVHADLVSEAQKALKAKPVSVIDKKITPPSGDKRDYMSLAPYFWPDPDKPDGKPYIRKDGKVNPDSRGAASDNTRMSRTMSAIETLAEGYQASKNEEFAKHAALLLNVWFLDLNTGMKPNLNFGQAIPGKNDGRCFGIIEGNHLLKAAKASGLLKGSPHWPSKDEAAITTWMAAYLEWLQTSPLGKEEGSRGNNHGTNYDVQVVRLANFLGQEELAKNVLEGVKNRIDEQITPDGRQPEELARTKSLDYSAMNLGLLVTLAKEGEKHGIDLWNYRGEKGQSIRQAFDYLTPLLLGSRKDWPYKQIGGSKPSKFTRLYQDAARAYDEPKYGEIARKIQANPHW